MTNYHATSEGNVLFTAQEEITWAAEQAEWTAGSDDRKAAEIRVKRNAELAATDWTQVTDCTADKPLWATYRQALRDVTAQADFPHNITWPEQPLE
jgi:hypothetical protein